VRSGGTMSSAAFWRLVDRLQIPDPDALELIGYAGEIGKTDKRPRFRLWPRQTHLAAYLPEIEVALQTIGERPVWLQRRNWSAPFSGLAPIQLMVERDGEGAGCSFSTGRRCEDLCSSLCRRVHTGLYEGDVGRHWLNNGFTVAGDWTGSSASLTAIRPRGLSWLQLDRHPHFADQLL
jgi:hypothetical protein